MAPLLALVLVGACRGSKLAASNDLLEDGVAGGLAPSCGLTSSLDRLTAAVEIIGRQQQQARTGRIAREGDFHAEERLLDLQRRVESLQAEVAAMRAGGKVYFNVLRQRKLVCFGCVVSFDVASADTHGAFELASGTFTAPVGGHYFFQFHALVDDRYEAQV